MTTTEKTREAIERIDTALQNINTDRDWQQFLSFQSRFYHYSARNTLLIFSQRPQASYVKGYKAWHELGRYVKRGATGIAILAPCIKKIEPEGSEGDTIHQEEGMEEPARKIVCGFTVKYVFDIADTDGSDEHLPVLVKGLSGNSKEEQKLYENLHNIISKEHLVKEVSGTPSKGSYNRVTGAISIRKNLEYRQKIKTLLHEYSHAVDFALNPDDTFPRNKRELIAESSAYVVASRLGVDTSQYSISYLKSWANSKDEIKPVADAVQKVSATIIDKLAESEDFAFLLA